MAGGKTFATIILTFFILTYVASANTNADADANSNEIINGDSHISTTTHNLIDAGKSIGKAIGGVVSGVANALKPKSNNFTEYPQAALVQEFIMAHNVARGAENMPPLVWNDTLAKFAEDWARKQTDCGMRHAPNNQYGENLFWGFQDHWLPREAVEDWVHEKVFYNKGSRTCASNKVCGHYTQVIWKTTEQVGCSRFRCSNGSLLIVCEYAPAGNVVDEDPFDPHSKNKKSTTTSPPSSSTPSTLSTSSQSSSSSTSSTSSQSSSSTSSASSQSSSSKSFRSESRKSNSAATPSVHKPPSTSAPVKGKGHHGPNKGHHVPFGVKGVSQLPSAGFAIRNSGQVQGKSK